MLSLAKSRAATLAHTDEFCQVLDVGRGIDPLDRSFGTSRMRGQQTEDSKQGEASSEISALMLEYDARNNLPETSTSFDERQHRGIVPREQQRLLRFGNLGDRADRRWLLVQPKQGMPGLVLRVGRCCRQEKEPHQAVVSGSVYAKLLQAPSPLPSRSSSRS